jgi:uncharacterized protein
MNEANPGRGSAADGGLGQSGIAHERRGHAGSFFLERDGERLAEMTYSATPNGKRIIVDHTEVSDRLKGQGMGRQLVLAAVEWARREGVKIHPVCPFAKSVFDRTPELRDVLG